MTTSCVIKKKQIIWLDNLGFVGSIIMTLHSKDLIFNKKIIYKKNNI